MTRIYFFGSGFSRDERDDSGPGARIVQHSFALMVVHHQPHENPFDLAAARMREIGVWASDVEMSRRATRRCLVEG